MVEHQLVWEALLQPVRRLDVVKDLEIEHSYHHLKLPTGLVLGSDRTVYLVLDLTLLLWKGCCLCSLRTSVVWVHQ
jgi:hypothetical protein